VHYLETRHFFLEHHTYPLQPRAILVSHGALPNLQTSKRKLESNTFAGNLLPPSWVTCISVQGPQDWGGGGGAISCCETLAYFKYTPVKAKIKKIANTHFCVVICNLDHTAIHAHKLLFLYSYVSLQMIQVKLLPWRPIGLWDIENLTLYRQMVARLSALSTGHTLLLRNIIFLFLVLISVRDWVNPRASSGLEPATF
jgi:hypothetical protein